MKYLIKGWASDAALLVYSRVSHNQEWRLDFATGLHLRHAALGLASEQVVSLVVRSEVPRRWVVP